LKQCNEQHECGELKASLGISKLTVDQQRIQELERELAIARMERDNLKKVTSFFANESNCNTPASTNSAYNTSCQRPNCVID
jgi:transposase-like protein